MRLSERKNNNMIKQSVRLLLTHEPTLPNICFCLLTLFVPLSFYRHATYSLSFSNCKNAVAALCVHALYYLSMNLYFSERLENKHQSRESE